jgi:hypothetical protein
VRVLRMPGMMALAVKIVRHVCLPVVNLMSLPGASLPGARSVRPVAYQHNIPYPLPYLEARGRLQVSSRHRMRHLTSNRTAAGGAPAAAPGSSGAAHPGPPKVALLPACIGRIIGQRATLPRRRMI